ncbi:MAG: hypothetical protein WBA97_34465 [Actinophytocola sp.]|uniref:hypothetical protein n=1 Tax=Actinophytocola sp. TaxID=1872138 RepID=UPI003C759096
MSDPVSGSIPLTQRLVEAAREEIFNAPHVDGVAVDYDVAARGAVVAVLRELIQPTELAGVRVDWTFSASDLSRGWLRRLFDRWKGQP